MFESRGRLLQQRAIAAIAVAVRGREAFVSNASRRASDEPSISRLLLHSFASVIHRAIFNLRFAELEARRVVVVAQLAELQRQIDAEAAAMAQIDTAEARRVAAETRRVAAEARRVAANAQMLETNRRLADLHANDQFPAGG